MRNSWCIECITEGSNPFFQNSAYSNEQTDWRQHLWGAQWGVGWGWSHRIRTANIFKTRERRGWQGEGGGEASNYKMQWKWYFSAPRLKEGKNKSRRAKAQRSRLRRDKSADTMLAGIKAIDICRTVGASYSHLVLTPLHAIEYWANCHATGPAHNNTSFYMSASHLLLIKQFRICALGFGKSLETSISEDSRPCSSTPLLQLTWLTERVHRKCHTLSARDLSFSPY